MGSSAYVLDARSQQYEAYCEAVPRSVARRRAVSPMAWAGEKLRTTAYCSILYIAFPVRHFECSRQWQTECLDQRFRVVGRVGRTSLAGHISFVRYLRL